MSTVENIISQGSSIRAKIQGMLGRYGYQSGCKNLLLVGYIDIIVEHHESVFLLVENKLCGSAFALLRSIFDSLYRALWVNTCASSEQIEDLSENDKFEFPRTMLSDIDESYATGRFFSCLKKHSWSSMCSYTHSGLLQISRRFTGNDILPNYSETETEEVLNHANIALLLATRLFFGAMNKQVEAQEVDDMLFRYDS
jgi:hypothetical protein